ncbi:MAG: NUDIX domain-containing protein [Bacteroidetes bacterium]|nr:NUDIX domain-containing protein [Bacteroidota bacterium]
MTVQNFNLRVYGLLIHDGHVLISHEYRGGITMTKFPGGGLEKGEGLADGLIREFREELDIEIQPGNFFYVNEFLQISAFNSNDQLLSFYYFVAIESNTLEAVHSRVNQVPAATHEQTFAWIAIENLRSEDFTFPIDRVVVEKLKAHGL